MVRINGGPTGAGKRRPLKEPAPAWSCDRGHDNPGYATRCLTLGCNVKRDEQKAA